MSATIGHDDETTADGAVQTVSRRGWGKHMVLGASALAVLLAAGKRDEALAAPTTDPWRLGGNTNVSTDGTNFLGTLNSAPLIVKTNNVERMRVLATGYIGVGTKSPQGALSVDVVTNEAIVARHTSTAGQAGAIRGETNATVDLARAITGIVTSTNAGSFSAGLWGENKSQNDNGMGVYGKHNGAGDGVYGVSLESRGVYGTGIYGVVGRGINTGVSGNSFDEKGIGVEGYSALWRGVSASGATHGVYATSADTGVYGQGNINGVYGTGPIGVYGIGSTYGVYGYSATGSAAYFQGKVTVTGTLSKPAGSFKIDHPLDPANKYLYHSFVESPDMMNVYNGNVVTDTQGKATITLPDYFEALNRDFRYQLTVVGQFAQAIIATEIADNRFTIATDKPNVKVSWQVTGIRKDAFANANRIPTEEPKAAADRGRYLHPELFGKPATQAVTANLNGGE